LDITRYLQVKSCTCNPAGHVKLVLSDYGAKKIEECMMKRSLQSAGGVCFK
jgi:hypothetical protein